MLMVVVLQHSGCFEKFQNPYPKLLDTDCKEWCQELRKLM